MTWAVPVFLAYLIGALPFAYLVSRLAGGGDPRAAGSGNPGATNVWRLAGAVPGAIVLVLDVGKGLLAVLVGQAAQATPLVLGAMGLAVVAGHIGSPFLGFRGGKGVATAAGVFAATAPATAFVGLLVFACVAAWKRYVSLASIVAASSFPLLLWAGSQWGWAGRVETSLLVFSGLTAALVVVRHAANIRRLMAGTEAKLGERAEVRAA